jgi:hypothetical protein
MKKFDETCRVLATTKLPVSYFEVSEKGDVREHKVLKGPAKNTPCMRFVVDTLKVSKEDYRDVVKKAALGSILRIDQTAEDIVVTFSRKNFLREKQERKEEQQEESGESSEEEAEEHLQLIHDLNQFFDQGIADEATSKDVDVVVRRLREERGDPILFDLKQALKTLVNVYMRNEPAEFPLRPSLELVHGKLLAFQTLWSQGCRSFGVPKDAHECAVIPFLEAVPVRQMLLETKWCESGGERNFVEKIVYYSGLTIPMQKFKDFASALKDFQKIDTPERGSKDCKEIRQKNTIKLRYDQKTSLFVLADKRYGAGNKILNETIEIDKKPLQLLGCVKFIQTVNGVDHYTVLIRQQHEEGDWVEINDNRVKYHPNMKVAMTKSAGNPKVSRFLMALYAREGYEPTLDVALGFVNLKNTCYMNASLQLLLRNDEFFDQIFARIASPLSSDTEED